MVDKAPPEPLAIADGVMFNAYPDSIGERFADTVSLLRQPELEDVLSLFYVLPTFFNSDLDRGFSIIDYGLNADLVDPSDLAALSELGIALKFDLVLNHLSVGSMQFQDLLLHGDASEYRDFFVDWNAFWASQGEMSEDGHVVPWPEHLERLFMRKPGLPILKVRFPDGTERPYWNTFYQEVRYDPIQASDLYQIDGMTRSEAEAIVERVNPAVARGLAPAAIELGPYENRGEAVRAILEGRRRYLGQMDLNARSDKVWAFYEETLARLRGYGARLIRLDAFAYLDKQPGMSNFFNTPGTWEYLDRLQRIADSQGLVLLPEIHAEYGKGLHEAVAERGFPIYDFFLPGLLIHALERGTSAPLRRWIGEICQRGLKTVNMLGCHDGIPMLDLKGSEARPGLLADAEIESIIDVLLRRGGRVKNLFGPDGRKIAYYQVNATYFSALGEDEDKLLLARAIQMFVPGIPQVWYLDLFAGPNDYEAADSGGTAGHKEINRTTLSRAAVEQGLQRPVVREQLALMRLRNTCPAFRGSLHIGDGPDHRLRLTWSNGDCSATLDADLKSCRYSLEVRDGMDRSSASA